METTTAICDEEKVTRARPALVAVASPAGEDDALTRSLKLLEVIQAAIRAGEVDTIRHTSEALKGSITSVLAREACAAASTLENSEREEDLVRAEDACRRLQAAITSLNPR
jgi:hypothetical protein